MIAIIKGTIEDLKPTQIIVDVQGVGYGLTIPLSTYEKIQSASEVRLHVYTLHREDQLRLYGFISDEEKQIFSMLLNISGIGPAMAISILSGISVPRLIEAVQTENAALLTKIPGIGTTKAEKLIFELKRKIKKLMDFAGHAESPRTNRSDAVEALVSLGFDDAKSSRIVDEIVNRDPDESIESIIKEALKILSA